MRYHRPETKGGEVRGFSAISQELGRTIWTEMLLHDDGMLGYGGTRLFGIGGQGGGKTTINTKFARLTNYVEGISKKDLMIAWDKDESDGKTDWIQEYGKKFKPETCIWRGREFDSWNVLAPDRFKQCYPKEIARPLRVHIHKGSGLKFFEQDEITGDIVEIGNLDVKEYASVAALYQNLVSGGTNVVYPPKVHYMSTRLKQSINMKRNVSPKDRKFLANDENYLVERDIFLFEIFEYLYRANLEGVGRKWFTAIIDESHDLFRSNSTDVYWHIVDCMVDVLVDTRKHNLSLACMTHSTNLIDYRIMDRTSHYIWLPGGKPHASSTIDPRVVRTLVTGQGIVESMMSGKFGAFMFDRIPNNNCRLVVDGLVEKQDLSSDIADEFASVTDSEVDDYIIPEGLNIESAHALGMGIPPTWKRDAQGHWLPKERQTTEPVHLTDSPKTIPRKVRRGKSTRLNMKAVPNVPASQMIDLDEQA